MRGLLGAAGLGVVGARSQPRDAAFRPNATKRPRAIAMWDFSWLERRWTGAGFEHWERALDELVERGYDAVRIDAYPHLIAANPSKDWLLKPHWDTQDWGAPTLVRVRVLPELTEFLALCRDRDVRVGLSSWFREDEDNIRLQIDTPEKLAAVWIAALEVIDKAGLLGAVLYVDLCNEWPGDTAAFVPPPRMQWSDGRSIHWMRTATAAVRAQFPALPLVFSTDLDRVEVFTEVDTSFADAIEHHLWMAGEHDDEFNRRVGYSYERFSETGYHNLQLKGAALYAETPQHWRRLLTDKIARLAAVAERLRKPLMTTECWAVVDYKDWPMLPWDWVKELCELGTAHASATGQWVAIATSNFCAPQFRGMWGDIAWHRRLTEVIKSGHIDNNLQSGRLWERL